MSRSTTFHGLTNQAKEWIHQYVEFENFYYVDSWFNKIKTTRPVTEVIGTCGMFHECELVKYKLKDGTYAEEFIQADPWASGPHVFVAIKHEGKEIGLWAEEAINILTGVE